MLAAATPLHPDPDTGSFLAWLGSGLDERRLTFSHDGHELAPGYHVTEVKLGRFSGLDCGANPEAWSETIVQLWDIDGMPGENQQAEKPRPMTVATFLAILGKFGEAVQLDRSARLTFEVSEPASPLRLYQVDGVDADEAGVAVRLAARPASCKPRDRWLQNESTAAAACCAPSGQNATTSCC